MSYNELANKKDTKSERLDVRLKPDQKEVIEKAASLRGLDTSAFVLSNALRAAELELQNYEKIELSDKDRNLFLSLVENPPEPNSALKKAAKEFKKKYG